MAKQNENERQPDGKDFSKKLLEKSAALKKKAALLKEQIEATANAYQELKHPDEKDSSSS